MKTKIRKLIRSKNLLQIILKQKTNLISNSKKKERARTGSNKKETHKKKKKIPRFFLYPQRIKGYFIFCLLFHLSLFFLLETGDFGFFWFSLQMNFSSGDHFGWRRRKNPEYLKEAKKERRKEGACRWKKDGCTHERGMVGEKSKNPFEIIVSVDNPKPIKSMQHCSNFIINNAKHIMCLTRALMLFKRVWLFFY